MARSAWQATHAHKTVRSTANQTSISTVGGAIASGATHAKHFQARAVLFSIRTVFDGVSLIAAGVANRTLIKSQNWTSNAILCIFKSVTRVDYLFLAIVTAEYANLFFAALLTS